MTGRDPGERHRGASPLELLFDLTFVVAFSAAASEFAHLLADDHIGAALIGFTIAMFAVCWAWINFAWFASAFDTDDWMYRTLTMVQMVGVLILAIGLAPMFASIDAGAAIDNRVMVFGYVVMRVALVAQWLRAAVQDPERRSTALTYAVVIVVAQLGWVGLALAATSVRRFIGLAAGLALAELLGPVLAERKAATPWHPHHIAERYGLLVIVALGEGVLGTVAALSAVIADQGWTLETATTGLAGVGLTWGVWWAYFILPSGDALARRRDRAWGWGYGHIALFAAVTAIGAGMDVAATSIAGESHLTPTATVVAVAVPVGASLLLVYVLYSYLVSAVDRFHGALLASTAAVIGVAVGLAAADVAVAWCLLVLAAAPVVSIVGYECRGHRHLAASLQRTP